MVTAVAPKRAINMRITSQLPMTSDKTEYSWGRRKGQDYMTEKEACKLLFLSYDETTRVGSGDDPRENVRLQQYKHANQAGQSDAMEEDVTQDIALASLLTSGDARHDDALRVDHLTHHTTATIGGCGEDR